jgi:copper chaperone CopZ
MRKTIFILTTALLFAFACNQGNKTADEAGTTPEAGLENIVEMTIPVYGMTCEGCENAVKKSVASLDGITEVSASHVDSVTVVKYDTTMVSMADIEGKIAEAGYTVGTLQ